jgi:hypothetical protein
MLQRLKIHIGKPGDSEPEKRITLPLSTLQISEKLLPRRTKQSLEREGIRLEVLADLFSKQGPKGKLVQVENAEEKIEILVE